MQKKIPLFSLVMLIVAAIDSIRNLPAMALFGVSLPFFFLLSAILFLIPVSLVSAEFSARFPDQGGVFHWIRKAFGEKMGFLAIWLQWINTMVWYPTMLSFIAGTLAYLINPALAESKLFLASSILSIFWGLTFVNLNGIRVSAKINDFCASIGTLLPMALIIGCGIYWVFSGAGIQISFDVKEFIPSWSFSQNWVALVAIMASFLGMELSGVHINDIENPKRNFPKAIGVSILILLFTMLFSSLSIAVALPSQQIHLVDGVMQFFSSVGLPRLFVPILTLMIFMGSVGNLINWLLSPAKGLLQAAEYGFLPSQFAKTNRKGVPVPILMVQAVAVSLFCLSFVLMPTVNAFYWFLTDLSTELYMLMYLLLFAAALRLGAPEKNAGHFRLPGGLRLIVCFLGIIGALLTIVVGYFPPSEIPIGSYSVLIAAGNALLIAPALLLMKRKKNCA